MRYIQETSQILPLFRLQPTLSLSSICVSWDHPLTSPFSPSLFIEAPCSSISQLVPSPSCHTLLLSNQVPARHTMSRFPILSHTPRGQTGVLRSRDGPAHRGLPTDISPQLPG